MEARPDLEQFLQGVAEARTRCKVCDNPQLKETLDKFMEAIKAGRSYVSLAYVNEHFILPQLGISVNKGTLYAHVKSCLKVDLQTGRPL